MSKIISNVECLTIISNYLNLSDSDVIALRDFEVKQKINEVVGYMGEYYGLKIRYSILNSDTISHEVTPIETFFIKLIPVNNPHHKKEIEEKGFFKKETAVYSKILKNLEEFCDEKCYARCLYYRPDMLVLEDLTTQNYQNLKDGVHYTMEHFKTVLKRQATLHVASLIYEHKYGINIDKEFGEDLPELLMNNKNTWYTTGLKGIVAIAKVHPKYQNSKYQEFFNTKLFDYLLKAEEKIKSSKKFLNVLCHRDSWDKNILFKLNNEGVPTDCAFVDFQLTTYSPPALDVLFFIYMNTKPKEHGNILKECLEFYFQELQNKIFKNNLQDNYNITWKEFCKSCEEIKVPILILCCVCFAMTYLPKGWADDMKIKDPSKFQYYMTVNRDEMFLNLINEHEYYKNILFESNEELIDCIWRNVNEKN